MDDQNTLPLLKHSASDDNTPLPLYFLLLTAIVLLVTTVLTVASILYLLLVSHSHQNQVILALLISIIELIVGLVVLLTFPWEDHPWIPYFLGIVLFVLFAMFLSMTFTVFSLFPLDYQPLINLVWASLFAMLLGFGLVISLVSLWIKYRRFRWIVLFLLSLTWLFWVYIFSRYAPRMIVYNLVVSLGPSCCTVPLILFLGLYATAGFLVPVPEKNGGREQVFKVLLDLLSGENRPLYVVVDEKRREDKIVQRGKGNRFSQSAFGPGIIITDCNHAVAVTSGLKSRGVLGPGVIFTGFAEYPAYVIDLRPQMDAAWVEAMTRDGIQVKALFFVASEINRGGRNFELGKPIPYISGAAADAIRAQEMKIGDDGPQQISWEKLPRTVGKRLLQDIISRYRFDELYSPHDLEGPLPRTRIGQEFKEKLAKSMREMGIHLSVGGIGNIEPVDEKVMQQRVRSWQADWARRVMLKQAQSHAERLRRIARARAEAQANLILSLGRMMAELERPGVGITPAMVMPEFLRALEEMASQPTLRRYLPRGTIESARRLRGLAEEREE